MCLHLMEGLELQGLDSTVRDIDHEKKTSRELPELLLQLRYAAINSSNMRFSPKTWTQLFQTRKALFMNATDIPWKKRKSHHLLHLASTTAHELPSRKKRRHSMEPKCKQSFIPCSTKETMNSVDSQQILENPCSPTCNFSKQSAFQNIIRPDKHKSNALGRNSDRPALQTSTNKQMCTVRLHDDHSNRITKIISTVVVSDEANDTSQISSTEKEVHRRSNRIKHLTGYHSEGKPIPVGELYQANIPEWTGPPDNDYYLESSKWLGEMTWPLEGRNSDTDMKLTGEGRQDTVCLCIYPDSMDCIKHHIREEAARLQSEIGNAFYSWGFDKMGEVVRESWTLQEQNDFNGLFRRKTALSRTRFWKRALRIFPFKQRKTIVSYYFNVFVLMNVRRQAKLNVPEIDSDDDMGGESGHKYKAPKSWLC